LITIPEIQQNVMMNGGADHHQQWYEYGINGQPANPSSQWVGQGTVEGFCSTM
jgi:hypothetical protein